MGTVPLGLVQAEAKVLAHPFDRETEVKLVIHHRVTTVVHLPRLGRALADHFKDLLHVQARSLAEGNALRQ